MGGQTFAHYTPIFSNVFTDTPYHRLFIETVFYTQFVIYRVILLNANGISGKAANKLQIYLLFHGIIKSKAVGVL